jgi:hypothetical protein
MPTHPWLVKAFATVTKSAAHAELTDEDIGTIADILGGIFGDDALDMFHKWVEEKSWNPAMHPRGQNGRFIPRGSAEAVSTAKDAIKTTLKGKKTAETHKKLVEHLSILTTKQLHEIKKEHGLSASADIRDKLIEKIADRLGRGRVQGGEEAKPSAASPAKPKPKAKPAPKPKKEGKQAARADAPKEAAKDTPDSGKLRSTIKEAFEHQMLFDEHQGGYMPIFRLYYEAKKRQPDLTVPEFHKHLQEMSKDDTVELHKLNEVHMAEHPDKAIVTGRGTNDERMYYYVLRGRNYHKTPEAKSFSHPWLVTKSTQFDEQKHRRDHGKFSSTQGATGSSVDRTNDDLDAAWNDDTPAKPAAKPNAPLRQNAALDDAFSDQKTPGDHHAAAQEIGQYVANIDPKKGTEIFIGALSRKLASAGPEVHAAFAEATGIGPNDPPQVAEQKARAAFAPEQRFPSKHNPAVDYGHADDRDSDDRHFDKKIGAAKKREGQARGNLESAQQAGPKDTPEIQALRQKLAEHDAKIAKLKDKPTAKPQAAKPQAAKPAPSPADFKPSGNIDDFLKLGNEPAAPVAPQRKPAAQMQREQAKPAPPPVPAKPPGATPPPLPKRGNQPPALPHQRTQQSALKAANAAARSSDPKAHAAAKQAIEAHRKEGIQHIKRMALRKHGNTPAGQRAAKATAAKFLSKINNVLRTLQQSQNVRRKSMPEPFDLSVPEDRYFHPWLVKAFEESEHPRDHGQFSSKPGASGDKPKASHAKRARKISKEAFDVSDTLAQSEAEGRETKSYLRPAKKARRNAAEAIKNADDPKLAREFHKDAADAHEDAAEGHRGYSGRDIRHAEAAKFHDKAARRHRQAAESLTEKAKAFRHPWLVTKAAHDVSGEARDESGKWTASGGGTGESGKTKEKAPHEMTKLEFETKHQFMQESWDELKEIATHIDKHRPGTLFTVFPSPETEGMLRVGRWDKHGPLGHNDIEEHELDDFLAKHAYERGSKRVVVEGGIGGTWPSENYAGAGFRPDSKGAKGVRSFVGPPRSVDWMSSRLASGGYKHRVEDIEEKLPEKTGVMAFNGETPFKSHGIHVHEALEAGKKVPDHVLADYPEIADQYAKKRKKKSFSHPWLTKRESA